MPFRLLLLHLRLLLVGLHLLSGALQVALLFRLAKQDFRHGLRRAWSRQLLRILRIRVDACAADLAGCHSGLLVGNHISFIDVFVLNALLPSAFVAKSDLLRWPLIGWLSRRNDTVFIERGSRKGAQRTRQEMSVALAGGGRLAIYPEGTTSAGDRVLPFHAALFQSAIDAEVPVHALALSYHGADGGRSDAPAYIDKLSLIDCLLAILQTRGLVARVSLAGSFRPPLPDRRHLAHRARHAIATGLAHIPGTAPAAQPLRNEGAIRQ